MLPMFPTRQAISAVTDVPCTWQSTGIGSSAVRSQSDDRSEKWTRKTSRTARPRSPSMEASRPDPPRFSSSCDLSFSVATMVPTAEGRYIVSEKPSGASPRSTFFRSLPEALRGSLPSHRST